MSAAGVAVAESSVPVSVVGTFRLRVQERHDAQSSEGGSNSAAGAHSGAVEQFVYRFDASGNKTLSHSSEHAHSQHSSSSLVVNNSNGGGSGGNNSSSHQSSSSSSLVTRLFFALLALVALIALALVLVALVLPSSFLLLTLFFLLLPFFLRL